MKKKERKKEGTKKNPKRSEKIRKCRTDVKARYELQPNAMLRKLNVSTI
jgi:hypothetical protein